ncbi:hypothetical protein [Haloarcula amylolytica]|uniref:Glycosyltransferase RgtA/B/C/D-like domain-containing protein n=1 Tax=Haloarcula amylolytica JCM 13557 TaxID=1227452 RepID=M0K7J7_9EURY|nr:hypothetical protein [Haloarcula amylolytica]EMA16119.1 hypothetical protein C442_18414 [Haloarcula amylolytica JCM 13557]
MSERGLSIEVLFPRERPATVGFFSPEQEGLPMLTRWLDIDDDDDPVAIVVTVVFAIHIAGLSIYRWVIRTVAGREFLYDAELWVDFGNQVLEGGVLYAQVPDNKPPIWAFINIVAAATPVPHLILLTVTGIGGGLMIWLVFRLLSRGFDQRSAAVGAAFTAYGIFVHTYGFTNNKTFALAFLLLGLVASSGRRAGLSYGIAGMIAQQIAFAGPVALWWEYRRGGLERLRTMTGAVIAVAVVSYALVLVIWGVDALAAGMRQSLLLVPNFIQGASQFQTSGSLFADPGRYVDLFHQRSARYLPHLFLAVFGAARVVDSSNDDLEVTYLGLALTAWMGLALFVRVWRHYWLLVLPGLAILAASGLHWILSREQ